MLHNISKPAAVVVVAILEQTGAYLMVNLYRDIEYIGEKCRNVTVLFSCGRDSAAMLHLFMTRARRSVGAIVFMYYAPDLSYDERILTHYERRYKIEIQRRPHVDTALMINTRKPGRRLTMADMEKAIRADTGAEFLSLGYRKTESLQRRGIMAHLDNGVEWKYRKVYPLSEWGAKHVEKYVAAKKLLIPEEYRLGFRDLNSFKGPSILYIRNNYPEDYKKIISIYPDVQGELMRYLNERKQA